jgi:hypothetical protein
MVLPSDGKVKDEESSKTDVDEDIDALLNEEHHEPNQDVNTITEEMSEEEKLKAISDRVVQTSMDIRRGENVLIVCDPTTAEIGQSLHEATQQRSDRVLLIVMPEIKTSWRRTPQSSCVSHATTAGCYRSNKVFTYAYPCSTTSCQRWCKSCYNAGNEC